MVFQAPLRSVALLFDYPQVNLLLILTRRRRSQVVRQRSAKPSSRVRFPPSPQKPANSLIAESWGKGPGDPRRAFGHVASPIDRSKQGSVDEGKGLQGK